MTAARTRRRVFVPRTVVLGFLAMLVFLAGYVLDLTLRGRTWSWLTVPVGGALVTLIGGIVTSHVEETYPPGLGGGPPPPGTRVGRRRSAGLAVLAVLVVVMAGTGVAAVAAARYVTTWVLGTEPGVERLVEPGSEEQQGLKLTVESVEDTRHFTRVTLTARNRVGHTVSLPLGTNCTLRSADGTTLGSDPFRGSWLTDLPDGSTQRGTIVFAGHLPAGETAAAFSFATIFQMGFGGPDSMTVRGLDLRPVDR